MHPLYRVAMIMIAVVALGGLIVKARPEPVVVEEIEGQHPATTSV